MPSLNYYVQQMHAHATGDRALPTTVANPPSFTRQLSGETRIEANAEHAHVTLTDLRLNGSEPVSGALDAETRRVRFPLLTSSADYTITLTARQTSGEEGFAIAFGALDSSYSFEWHFGTWKNRYLSLYYKADGDLDEFIEPIPFSVELDRDYQLEIRVEGHGRRVTCLLDGAIVQEAFAPERPEQRFSATAVRDSETDTVHVKIVNATAETVQAHLGFTGDLPRPAAAEQITLAAPPDAGAPFEPAPASPVTTAVDISEPLSIDPYSFTVVSIPSR
jgi:hypothetical protein